MHDQNLSKAQSRVMERKIHFRYMADPALWSDINKVRAMDSLYKDIPFLKTPSVNSTTSNSTPPPGASLSTLGTKPLYSAAGPSSRKIVISLHGVRSPQRQENRMKAYAGYVQLYFGITPGNFSVPWMRDLTTCIPGVSLDCRYQFKNDLLTSNLAMKVA
jgi:hypothetical protein